MRPVTHPESMSASPMNNSISIPHLHDDRANWPDYELKVRMAIGSQGLIRHIDGKARKPIPYLLTDRIPMKTPGIRASDDELEEKENKMDEYERKEYAAQHILLTTVSPRLAIIVKRMSVADTWTTIHNNATSKSQLHKVDGR